MAILRAPVTSAVFEFVDGVLLGKLLQFPEASALDRRTVRLEDDLRVQAEKLADQLEPLGIHRCQLAAEVRVEPIQVAVDPPREDSSFGNAKRGNVVWREPIQLTVQAFIWTVDEVHFASLPLLKISVVAENEVQLVERIQSQVQFVLVRHQRVNLESLLLIPQPEKTICKPHELTFAIKTPKEIHRLANATKPASVLKDIADDLRDRYLRPIFGRQSIVREAAELLANSRPTSVLFIGDSGVGKTAIAHELVRMRDELGLPFRAYWQTEGSRIVAGMCGFGAWQERCEELCREVHDSDAMLHLGNLFELMEVGQHESSELGIGDYLRPVIDSGKLPCTAECTPQQLDEIQRRNPRMLDAFEQIAVPQTSLDVTREILGNLAARLLAKKASVGGQPANQQPVPLEAIETTLQLHKRFATYSSRPGRVVRFFTYLIEDWNSTQQENSENAQSLDAERTIAAFSQQTGLPRPMLDETVPLDLAAADAWFNRRVIGQEPAVSRVLDALASVKTSLTRPQKPIASFLMIGPTGVGKTELAKTLTEFLYKNPDRMTRIDMSEYADPLAAERLAGSSWQEEGVLTSRVREQPFGVVLLDEFEKAHHDVFDLLLQILGEGRLTDSVGRVADFSTSVVIMTSNLGAESAGKSDAGFQPPDEAHHRLADHYVKEVRRFLRPEIFNRIDSVIPFSPLSKTTVEQIVNNQLDELKQRVTERCDQTSVEFAPEVVDLIATRGYEPTLGARPIRRQIERMILAPISARLNEEQTKRGGTLHVNCTMQGKSKSAPMIRVRFRSPEANDAFQLTHESQLDDLARRAMKIRRRAVLLGQNYVVEELRNERNRLHRQKLRIEAKKKAFDHRSLLMLDRLNQEIDEIELLVDQGLEFEEQTLLTYYRKNETDPGSLNSLEELASELERSNHDLLLRLFAKSRNVERVAMILLAQDIAFAEDAANAFRELFREWKMESQFFQVNVRRPNLKKLPRTAFPIASELAKTELAKTDDPRNLADRKDIEFLGFPAESDVAKEHRDSRIGFAFELNHGLAAARLQDEVGYHHRVKNGQIKKLELFVTSTLDEFEPPTFARFREDLRTSRPRRTYDLDKLLVQERIADESLRIKRTDPLWQLLRHFIERNVEQRAKKWLESAGGATDEDGN